MYLCYFDENKYSEADPFFHIGGVIIPESALQKLEDAIANIQADFFGTRDLTKDTEMHGKLLFHGKGVFKRRTFAERLGLLRDIVTLVIDYALPVRMVTIDVKAHRQKYYVPEPEYKLGLMLILERFSEYLDKGEQCGLVFGDYERDEMTQAILDFCGFKANGKTPMYFGRPIGRLIDTIYFTHSHHSRFLQVADILVFIANRCHDLPKEPEKFPDRALKELWMKLRKEGDFQRKYWP